MDQPRLSAIAYIRVSSQRQVTDGNSLTVQKNLVARFAAIRGFTLRHTYVEEAESAKTDNRPVLQKMLGELQAGTVAASVLIIPKIDRLSRNRDDYGKIKAVIRQAGLRVESCSENLEDTPAGRFTESVVASAAQFDNEVRSERSKDGMIQAVTEGRWAWKAPLGYKNVRLKVGGKKGGLGNIEPDEPMATLIREVFKRIAFERQTPNQVRFWLENRGVRVTRGNMHHLLHNRLYSGVIEAFGQEFTASPPFVPLVSPEVFQHVQTLISRKLRSKAAHDFNNPDYPLRGTLRCEHCNRFLTSAWSKGRNERFPYYRCLTCRNMNLPRDWFELAFENELSLLRANPDRIVMLKQYAVQAYEERISGSIAERQRLQVEVDRVSKLRQQMALKIAEGIIPDDVGKEQMEALTAELGRLTVEIKNTEIPADHLEKALDFAGTFLNQLPLYWRKATTTTQKKLQAFFFPEGLVAEKAGNLRTVDYPLLEQVKQTLRPNEFDLVDPAAEIPNQVLTFILELQEKFDDSSTLLDQT
ncbi:MAG: recombinase family protein [Fimbriimonadaceae bacterium]